MHRVTLALALLVNPVASPLLKINGDEEGFRELRAYLDTTARAPEPARVRKMMAWSQYIDKNKMTWPQYLDAGGKIARLFGVQGSPTYIVLDGDGLIRARKSGYGLGTDGWLENEIKKTLTK